MVFSSCDAGPVGRLPPWDGADLGFLTSWPGFLSKPPVSSGREDPANRARRAGAASGSDPTGPARPRVWVGGAVHCPLLVARRRKVDNESEASELPAPAAGSRSNPAAYGRGLLGRRQPRPPGTTSCRLDHLLTRNDVLAGERYCLAVLCGWRIGPRSHHPHQRVARSWAVVCRCALVALPSLGARPCRCGAGPTALCGIVAPVNTRRIG